LKSQRRRLWLTLALGIAAPALAADPQPYTVTIHGTGIGALDSTLHASSQLESLRKGAPVGPFALIGRAQDDAERLATVIESFGYYRRALYLTIEGKALDDPSVAELLAGLPKDHAAKVDISIELGPLYHLRKITLDGEVSEQARQAMQLESGEPAVAANVLAAHDRLLNALEEEGHALAKVEPPVAYEDRADPVLDVEFKVDAGPAVHIGAILLTGMTRTHEAFIRKRLLLHPGEQYSPSRIERARTDLLALGVFAGVTVHPASELDPQGNLPITFELRERKLHAVSLNAAYSSDLGGSAGATWSNRNLFGNAEQLNLSASAINLGGNATTGLGYDFAAQLIKPDFLQRDQSLQFSAADLKQDLIAYQQTAATLGASLNRKLSRLWTVSAGVGLEEETIVQETAACTGALAVPSGQTESQALAAACKTEPSYFTLISLPLSVRYDSTGVTNPLDDPLRGMRATLTVTPTESLGAGTHAISGTTTRTGSATFTIVQSTISSYFDLERIGWSERGRSVIALRALGGLALGATEFGLPPDQRFYGGGSLTVRGYPYQGIGPVFLDGNPIGGTSIAAVGAELRQRIGRNWGTVFFVDAGDVTDTTKPFHGTVSIGFGTGLRYYTPIGPIRLDLGFPGAHPASQGYPFVEIYVGLGQVF
jgi:translocation and assembly module TamA